MSKLYKIVVFVPTKDADKIRQVLGEVGAGRIGNYDFVTYSSKGVGRFRPLKGARPAIGEIGKLEEVEEERIETVVEKDLLTSVVQAVEDVHPYEEPVIDIYELEN